MTAIVSRKAGALAGEARVPGDKSISHRALMIGANAIGETRVHGLLEGDDVMATAESLRGETVARANAEAADIVRKARDEAAGEKERAAGAIRTEVAALSMAVAEKAVAGAVDAKAHQKLVDQYIAELGALRP